MGEYVVNGEVVDVREDRPTAGSLKKSADAVPTDWVMASLPGGEIVKLDDNETLPADATDYSIVTPFTYGVPWGGATRSINGH